MPETQATVTTTTSVTAPERLTWAEIRARYPEEHVCLVDMLGADHWTGSAVVYAHHPNKKTLLAMSRHLRACGIFWTGRMTDIRRWMLDRVAREL